MPEQALNSALDNLGNQVSAAADFDKGGEDIAYALYDLARAGRAAIGDLRYYLEARLDHFGSPLAQAQLGAALALYGDRARAGEAFTAALDGLKTPDDPKRWRDDYGSQLRDTAGVLALAAEFTPGRASISRRLPSSSPTCAIMPRWTSTQEDAWTLVAAAAAAKSATAGSVTVDGKALTGTVYQKYQQEHFDTAPGGHRQHRQPADRDQGLGDRHSGDTAQGREQGLHHRACLLHARWHRDRHQQGQAERPLRGRADDHAERDRLGPVCASPIRCRPGSRSRIPDLSSADGVRDLSWLERSTRRRTPRPAPTSTSRRSATPRTPTIRVGISTAYMVRAVSPGKFVQPGATVEDMYRPDLRANTDAARSRSPRAGP